MDKIWYRNHSESEIIGHCGGDKKKRMATQNRQKWNAKKYKTIDVMRSYMDTVDIGVFILNSRSSRFFLSILLSS